MIEAHLSFPRRASTKHGMNIVTGSITLRVKCRQCDSMFLSNEELESHKQVSHNICTDCDRKFPDWTTLKAHFREFRCAYICEGCDGIWNTAAASSQHQELLNVCKICQRHFDTPSNLIHHELTHRKPIYDCPACPRKFSTYSGMIIHLESVCFQGAKFFIHKSDREAVKQGVDLLRQLREDGRNTLIFRCPTCKNGFSKLSGMFMHVESPACSQKLGEGAVGKLRIWINKCHVQN